MSRRPRFRLGDTLTCKGCGNSFRVLRSTQSFCTRDCAIADKSRRPRPIRNRDDPAAIAWRAKHHERLKAYRRERYLKNRAEILAKQKEYLASIPKAVLTMKRQRWNQNYEPKRTTLYQRTRERLPWLNSLRGAKQRAKRDGLPFLLTQEWAASRWTGRCEVTDIEFVFSTGRNPYLFSPSLDRIIPSLGYTPDNCRFVLHAVNALKGAGTNEQMLQIAKAIVSNSTVLVPT